MRKLQIFKLCLEDGIAMLMMAVNNATHAADERGSAECLLKALWTLRSRLLKSPSSAGLIFLQRALPSLMVLPKLSSSPSLR